MAKDKYYYHQLPLTKNMQTSDTFTGERKCISIPNHKRKIKNNKKMAKTRIHSLGWKRSPKMGHWRSGITLKKNICFT